MKIITPKTSDWNNFVANSVSPEFLQDRRWSNIFSPDIDNYLAVVDADGNLLAGVQWLNKATLGVKYLFSPRGPVFAETLSASVLQTTWQLLSEAVTKQAKQRGCWFWRLEPSLAVEKWSPDKRLIFSLNLEPSLTWLTNLVDDDTLIKGMHPKTRYNIRLAQKKSLVFRQGGIDDLEVWWKLLSGTSDRDGFAIHSKEHYKKILELGKGWIDLFLVEFSGQAIAAGLFNKTGVKASYIHGASNHLYRHLMAPYLLHWEVMRHYREQGAKVYDWFGVDEKKWPGVTRFKQGFGGQLFSYPGTLDLPISSFYYRMYRVLRQLRRLLPI